MRILIVALLLCSSESQSDVGSADCPAGCFCDTKKSEHVEGVRVHCVQLEDGDLDTGSLPNNTLQLSLSGYGLRAVGANFFSNMKYLEKVDLSGNKIKYLDEEAFRGLSHLKTLDLSSNQLTVLTMDSLHGLAKLERLKLNNNKIQTIEFGAFSHLTNIQKIDLADNPLLCDCNLAWLLGPWLEIAGARARCAAPPALRSLLLRKLASSELTCDVPMVPSPPHSSGHRVLDLRITPSLPQIVFSGDSLRLVCRVGLLTHDLLVRWFHNDQLVEAGSSEDAVSITSLGPSKRQPRPGHRSELYIGRLREAHSGNWSCAALLDTGRVSQNTSVSVAVISAEVVLCPPTSTNTSKGLYHWGVTVAGHSASQQCHNTSHTSAAMVEYSCTTSGVWGVLNDSSCGHISDVTDKLHKFATMNDADFDQNTLIQSARMLLEFTRDGAKFRDGMDLVYLSTALENYLPYLPRSQELASLLVDIAANTMRMAPDIIYQGQLLGHAASRLIATIANISRIVPAFQLHRPSLAVESFKVSPRSFAGITCSWYEDAAARRVFSCSENNVTVSSPGTILGSVQLPSTLYYQLQLLDRDVNIAKNIMFTVFSNSSLFPQIATPAGPSSVHRVISSCVLGSAVVAAEPFNLSEPVYVILRVPRQHAALQPDILPAWWDPRANQGLGAWAPEYCRVMAARADRTVFSCSRLGHYALLAASAVAGAGPGSGAGHSASLHTAVYSGTMVSVLLLCCTVCMFTCLYSRIQITKKMKHALPNFWMSLIFFLVFSALSVSVQSAEQLCLCVGVLLHYFTLTTCLWLALLSSIVHRKLVNPAGLASPQAANPYVATPLEEVRVEAGGGRRRRPLAQLYMIGWGVPLLVCGVTAAASRAEQYSGDWCFLSLAPAIGAVIIPLVLVTTIHLFFILAIFSFSPGPATKLADCSGSSRSTLLVADPQHGAASHARVLLLVSLLLAAALVSGTLSVTAALPESVLSAAGQRSVFSLAYSGLVSVLALLSLGYYCLARREVARCPRPWGCTVQDETSNLVDLSASKSLLQNNANQYTLDTTAHTPKAGFAMVELGGGSVLGPSTGGRLKQCNLERQSEDDYHSVNNSQHLSRPRTGLGGLSESEVNRSMSDILFGASAKIKVNNVNIHMADTEDKSRWMEARSDWSVPGSQCYYPPPAPAAVSPMELPYPDMSHVLMPPSSAAPRHAAAAMSASLPRRHGQRPDRRRRTAGGSVATAHSDMERTEIYSSSRVSEVSSSTAASLASRASKNRKRSKPRRKPRKRSEVFPTSSSGSGSKRATVTTYDPIMEVSFQMDEEGDDETDLLVKPTYDCQVQDNRSSEDNEDEINKTSESATCHNNTDNEDGDQEDNLKHMDNDESLASKLLNRETCV